MNKIILTAAIASALALTLSCSNGGDDDSGGSGEVFTLTEKKSDRFTYEEVYEEENCASGGTLKTEKYVDERTVRYSIKNNVMTWESRRSDDTLKFKGSSNELIGTWTRTKNKAASCELQTSYYDGESYYECKEGYDITKAVFTETTVAITRDICETDEIVSGSPWRRGDEGWKMRPINCDSYEIYKGAKVVTVKENGHNVEVSSGGKTCKMSEPSKSQKQAACKEAWNKSKSEYEHYYWEILEELEENFFDCLKQKMPEGFWVERDDYCDIYPDECGGGDDRDYCDIYPNDPYCNDDGDDRDYCDIYPYDCYCEANPDEEICDDYWGEEGSLLGKTSAAKPLAKLKAKTGTKVKAKANAKFKFKPLLKKKK